MRGTLLHAIVGQHHEHQVVYSIEASATCHATLTKANVMTISDVIENKQLIAKKEYLIRLRQRGMACGCPSDWRKLTPDWSCCRIHDGGQSTQEMSSCQTKSFPL